MADRHDCLFHLCILVSMATAEPESGPSGQMWASSADCARLQSGQEGNIVTTLGMEIASKAFKAQVQGKGFETQLSKNQQESPDDN